MKATLCKIGFHRFKCFKRTKEVNWLLLTVKGKRCVNCHKEIIEECF